MRSTLLSLIYPCFLLFTLVSCEKHLEDPQSPTGTNYLILNGDTPDGGEVKKGGVSIYSYPADVEKADVLDYSSPFSMNWYYSTALVHDGFAYVSTRKAEDLVKFSLSNQELVASSSNERAEFIRNHKTMVFHQNQLIVGYSKSRHPNIPGYTYLKFYDANNLNEVDSVFLQEGYDMIDAELIGDKLYISLSESAYDNNRIIKLDIAGRKVEEELTIQRATQLAKGSRGELYAFSGFDFWKLDPQSLNITMHHEALKGTPLASPGIQEFAIDEENSMLYYFREAPQPAPFLFLLASYNLNTKEEKTLQDYDGPAVNYANIILDREREELVTAQGHKLIFFDKEGTFLREKELAYKVSRLVMY